MTPAEYEIQKLRELCPRHGLELTERPNGHIQVRGAMLVNYYPAARTRTAYVAGTAAPIKHATAEKVVAIAGGKEGFAVGKVERRKSYRSVKVKLLARTNKCHWCTAKLTLRTATLDHLIPLSRGGLNNMNNYVLACEPCNKARGNDLPVGLL